MGNEHRDLLGRDVLTSDGVRAGHVVDVYVDPETGAPKWLVLPPSALARRVSFVPAHGAVEDEDGRVVVAFTRKQIRRAPHPDADGDLSTAEEADLARHYLAAARHDEAAPASPGSDPGSDPTVEAELHPPRGEDPTDEWLIEPGPSDSSMVRAEEEVRVEATPRPAQRARLVKRVVTEQVTFTVPVRREVLHLEYDDILDEGVELVTTSEPFTPVPDQEIVLYAEIVEYEKKVVPKERVRLHKEVVDEVVDLRTDVRKEEVDVVGSSSEPTFI